ncbi:phosphatidylserine decarboxylase [Mucilaginibacter sp. AW1-3]
MTFHKEGYTSLALCVLFIFVLNALLQFYIPQAHVFKWIIYILSFALFAFVVQFFRNPSIAINTNDKAVLSPADGKITGIEEVNEPEYLKDKSIRISIHLSPLNPRVTRNPISGIVKHFKYRPKSAAESERAAIAIQNSAGTNVLLHQTSGAFISGIVSDVKEGDTAKQGEPLGFVKFGNRVDVFLPSGAEVKVEPGETVTAGDTVLAQLKS